MIEPQLVIIFNNHIEKIYLLTLSDDIEFYQNSKAYIYYINLKTDVKLTILKSHILLTYNIKTTKIFLNTLLNIDFMYVMYSDEGDVEYSYVINTLFNPYETSYEFNENNDVLYKNYEKCFNGLILYITEYNFLPKIYPEYNIITDNNLLDFNNKMFKEYVDFEIKYTYEKENLYLMNITNSEILVILKEFNYLNYKTTYIMKKEGMYYMQGNNLRIFDFDKLLFNKSESLLIITKEDSIILVTDGFKIYCEENELLEYILKLIKKYRIERVSNKIIYNMTFNININPNMQLSNEFSNILLETNSKNIYLTTDKQATVIFTKKKIIVKMVNKIEQLAIYITELILYYSTLDNKKKKNITGMQKKIGISYLSRICQNVETKMRKPFIYSKNTFDLTKYNQNKDLLYKNENGEIYIDKETIYQCDAKYNIGRQYIGFIEKFYVVNKLCIPCCYLYSKENDEIFKNCTTNNLADINNTISPYILTFNKVLSINRLSFLYPSLDKTFNKNGKIKIESNRIAYAKDFYCITYFNNEIIETKQQIFDLIKDNNVFIFLKNIILCPYIDRYIKDLDITKPIKFFVLVQNILHVIVKINKDEDKDKIHITTDVSNLYEYIKDYNKSIMDPFKISNSGLVYNENGFYIDGVKFTQKLTTNYLSSISYIKSDELINDLIDIENIEIEDLPFFINSYNTNELLKIKKQ